MEIIKVLIVLAALAVFGVGYNTLVGRMEQSGHDRGYTAFLVVGGCMATIGGSAMLIGVDAALLELLCFAASGLPMTLGSMFRHAQRQKADDQKAQVLANRLLNGEGGEE